MPIVVSCECGMKFHARDEHAGRRAKCPDCGRILVVPDSGVAPAGHTAPTGPQVGGATPPPPPGQTGAGHWPRTQSLAAPGTPLIYTDYGIPYAQLSRPVAKLQSLKYFNERWVTVGIRSVLRRQRAVIRGIRLFFVLSMISAALVLIAGPVLVAASAPLGASLSAGMLAWWLVFLIIFAGAAVLWYFAMQWNQVCCWILVGLHALFSLVLIVYTMVIVVSTYMPATYLVPTVPVLLINGLVIWVLACPTTASLYRFNQTH